MSFETPFEYYSDSTLHGHYQFVTLKEVLDGMMLRSMTPDSYLKGISRALMHYHAKIGVKTLAKGAARSTKLAEITIGNNRCITLPQDCVSYVRVSLVMPDYRLMPLDISSNFNIAIGYLQDHNWEILFDEAGEILTADSSNAYNKPYRRYEYCHEGGQYGLDTAKLSKWGEFDYDEDNGKLVFSEDLINREVVIEYLSDGLQDENFRNEDIKVHKHIEEALKAYIYEACIADLRNVPPNEKERASRRYKTLLSKAKKARAGFNLMEINRLLRTRTMNP